MKASSEFAYLGGSVAAEAVESTPVAILDGGAEHKVVVDRPGTAAVAVLGVTDGTGPEFVIVVLAVVTAASSLLAVLVAKVLATVTDKRTKVSASIQVLGDHIDDGRVGAASHDARECSGGDGKSSVVACNKARAQFLA